MPPVPHHITPEITRLCQRIVPDVNPMFLKVTPFELAISRYCFPNVEDVVKKRGGGLQHGWQIWEWPHHMLEAEFHGVWKRPNGKYTDITPKEPPVQDILFLPDDIRNYDGIPFYNVREPLRQSDLLQKYISLSDEIDQKMGKHCLDGSRLSPASSQELQVLQQKQSDMKLLVQEELDEYMKNLINREGSNQISHRTTNPRRIGVR